MRIAYVGLAYVNKDVKAVHISYDKGKTFVEPSVKNAINKTLSDCKTSLFLLFEETRSKSESFC